MSSFDNRYLPPPVSTNFAGPSICPLDRDLRDVNATTRLRDFGCSNPPALPRPLASTFDLQREYLLLRAKLFELQLDHERLLDTFSQLKTRNSTLANALATLDKEIIDLTDNNICFKAHIHHLEQNVKKVSKNNSEFQRVATRERVQYAEIVSKLIKLEKIGHDEIQDYSRIIDGLQERLISSNTTNEQKCTSSIQPRPGREWEGRSRINTRTMPWISQSNIVSGGAEQLHLNILDEPMSTALEALEQSAESLTNEIQCIRNRGSFA